MFNLTVVFFKIIEWSGIYLGVFSVKISLTNLLQIRKENVFCEVSYTLPLFTQGHKPSGAIWLVSNVGTPLDNLFVIFSLLGKYLESNIL